jgi:hydrogenase-4 component E
MTPVQLLDLGSMALLASTVFLVVNRQLARGVGLLCAQSIILTLIALLVGVTVGSQELFMAALLTLLIKAIGATFVLSMVLRSANTRVETDIVSRGISLAIVLGLILVAFQSVPAALPLAIGNGAVNTLPIAISMVLIGVFMMVTRKKALMTAIGLITVENGLFLFALSTTYGVPTLVELCIFCDVAISILMLGYYTIRINRLFDTMNVDKLDELRG